MIKPTNSPAIWNFELKEDYWLKRGGSNSGSRIGKGFKKKEKTSPAKRGRVFGLNIWEVSIVGKSKGGLYHPELGGQRYVCETKEDIMPTVKGEKG